jgi:hypothetical protein
MQMSARTVVLAATTLALLLPGEATRAADPPKPKKPGLTLRATPRFAFSPAMIFLTAELQGGDDVEDLYCPEVEWEWSDGGKSVQESDCPPFEAGVTKIQRRFTAEHEFRRSGNYLVVVRLRHSGKTLAKSDVSVQVRPGLTEQPARDPGVGN